jgi:hypothetical protein
MVIDYSRKSALLLAESIGYIIKEGNVYHPKKVTPVKLYPVDGYPTFSVRSRTRGIKGLVAVHRLLAYRKYGDAVFDNNIEVRHLDADRSNFSYENIVIGTALQNSLDKPTSLRRAVAIIASSHKRVLSNTDVASILEMRKNNKTYKQIGAIYGISKSTLSYLFNKSYYAKNL